MALPETDLEYLLNGEPEFVEARLRRLGMLSDRGLAVQGEIRALIAAAKTRYDPNDTGPSYVHSLAAQLFERGILNEDALTLHGRGKRTHMERWADLEFMTWIGESERYIPPAGSR
ncbi:MAG TPA: hypothetical protein VFP58_15090 [Candidatus Eisenbacteria bacterium]|nr:hypothetical protein [Candidatus Eisenbacteria bacterium]